MLRRLAVSLLCAAIALAGVASTCCAGGDCPMADARMDCCDGPAAGITAPSCCDQAPELSRNSIAPAADRPAHGRLKAPLAQTSAVKAILAAAPRVAAPERSLPRGAPPGGTLVAQHTSLLL